MEQMSGVMHLLHKVGVFVKPKQLKIPSERRRRSEGIFNCFGFTKTRILNFSGLEFYGTLTEPISSSRQTRKLNTIKEKFKKFSGEGKDLGLLGNHVICTSSYV